MSAAVPMHDGELTTFAKFVVPPMILLAMIGFGIGLGPLLYGWATKWE